MWNPPADPISTIQTGQFTNQDGNGNGNDMENGSATFAVVSGYHGTYNQDLDNDGQLDITPWASVISAVGWTETLTILKLNMPNKWAAIHSQAIT